jgi:hypothetical protein
VVWFYRNQASLSIYVRPFDKDGCAMGRDPQFEFLGSAV